MNDSKSNKFIALFLIPSSVMADWMKTDPETRKAAEEKMKAEWQKWMSDHSKMITLSEACGKTKRIQPAVYLIQRMIFVYIHSSKLNRMRLLL